MKNITHIRTPRRFLRRELAGFLLLACWLGVVPAQAQQTPVLVAAKQITLDEQGRPLSNAEGDLVQFLLVNGQVYVPTVDGQPHPSNPVIYASSIGNGVANTTSTVGRFNAAITPYPSAPIVARVFNAPSLAAASFYADSQIFTPNGQAKFNPVFGATTNALDPADDDGDGVNNSWEKSLGSDRHNMDSDGDGVGDGHEFRAGTSLTNNQSYLAMVQVLPQAGGHLAARWDSVPGKAYQLQFTASDLTEPNLVFSNISSVVSATGEVTSVVVTNGAAFPMGIFRVMLAE